MTKTATLLALIAAISLMPPPARVQADSAMAFAPGSESLSLGVNVLDRAGNLGLGLELTSPYFFKERAAARVRGEFLWDKVDWNLFYALKAGLLGVGGYVADGIRLYGEGGVLFVIPTAELSTDEFVVGGYGHFGFEFLVQPFARSHVSYLIELGTSGLNFEADQLSDPQRLLNGFAVTTGLRIYWF